MQDIVNWLIRLESLAGSLYRDAASIFADTDSEFAELLERLAEDEAGHFHVMGSAANYLRSHGDGIPPSLTLDPASKDKIETLLIVSREKLLAGSLTKDEMLACLVKTEFSEWNDFFLYVINSMKEINWEFQYSAARMHRHTRGIKSYLESQPQAEALVSHMGKLPSVWKERILIVEDAEPIIELLKAVLSGEGAIDTAENGDQAFRKTTEQYYDLIISDIKMPVMDGIEFYRKTAELDPEVGKRFLFFAGSITIESQEFFRNNRLRYLKKPASVDELKRTVIGLLRGTSLPG